MLNPCFFSTAFSLPLTFSVAGALLGNHDSSRSCQTMLTGVLRRVYVTNWRIGVRLMLVYEVWKLSKLV